MDGDSQSVRLVVGLGNPGREYSLTRHNMGYRVVDELVWRWNAGAGRLAFGGRVFEARPQRGDASARVMLLQPHTYMNGSGTAVRELVGFYKVPLDNLLVVLDDLALGLGQLRLRPDGSAGGQKGLAHVIEQLGSTKVPRLRVGIGAPPRGMDAVDYVLQMFAKAELETVESAVRQAAAAVEHWLFEGIVPAMDKHNRKLDEPSSQ